MVAEVDDALMEIPRDRRPRSQSFSAASSSPSSREGVSVLAVSVPGTVAVRALMDALVDLTPAPDARGSGGRIERKRESEDPQALPPPPFIFKTIAILRRADQLFG
jgi:hypothetical protein